MRDDRCETIDQILLGDSAGMEAVRNRVRRIADGAASIIVTGPSGSGKECVARALHVASNRAAAPFVAVNCGAIPRELMESELFGHERGAFTGAHAARAGRFEQAQGGTLFLDEIGDMPVDMQVKLLRALEERQIERVGGNRPIAIDVRIVSATHRDLEAAIAAGTFREDLYYRLAVIPVNLPSLAERPDDIALLLRHFLDRDPRRPSGVSFTPDGLDVLTGHRWPGNVRELRNLAERAAILHPGEVIGATAAHALVNRKAPRAEAWSTPDATPKMLSPRVPFDLANEMARIEADYIRDALTRSGGVVAAAARALGLRRTTLIEKIRRYDLVRSDDQASAIGSIVSMAC